MKKLRKRLIPPGYWNVKSVHESPGKLLKKFVDGIYRSNLKKGD